MARPRSRSVPFTRARPPRQQRPGPISAATSAAVTDLRRTDGPVRERDCDHPWIVPYSPRSPKVASSSACQASKAPRTVSGLEFSRSGSLRTLTARRGARKGRIAVMGKSATEARPRRRAGASARYRCRRRPRPGGRARRCRQGSFDPQGTNAPCEAIQDIPLGVGADGHDRQAAIARHANSGSVDRPTLGQLRRAARNIAHNARQVNREGPRSAKSRSGERLASPHPQLLPLVDGVHEVPLVVGVGMEHPRATVLNCSGASSLK